MTESRCHHTDAGPMLATHQADCERADCGGCERCPEAHCTARSRCLTHVAPTELTCPGCIGQTRTDLAQVVELSALMLGEAIVRGINSEAANLAGPAADPAVWSARQVIKRRHITEHLPAEAWEYATRVLIEDDDDWHPLLVLGRWEMMLREDWGPETDTRLTVSSAADYLERNLPRLANDPAQDFPLFAAEIRACRTHLEAVLHDSRQPEKGAPCPTCNGLRTPCPTACNEPDCRDYCHEKHTPNHERNHQPGDCPNKPADRLVKRYDDSDHTGASDIWTCPRTRDHWWSEADYRRRVGITYLQHADTLTADQIHTTYRIPPGTLRRWASEGKVAKRGKDDSGRQLYTVQDALDQRDLVVP